MAIRIASDFLSLYPPMMHAKQNGGKISRNGGRKKILRRFISRCCNILIFSKVREGAFWLYSSLETRCGVAGMIYCYSFCLLFDFVSYLCSGIGREV